MQQKNLNFERLYKLGIIADWYLRYSQYQLYKQFENKNKIIVKTNRRFGKSTTAFTYIFEQCTIRKIIVRYGGPTQKQANEIIRFLVDNIYYKAPKMKPQYNSGRYVFPSGSEIYIFGGKDSGEIDKGRGSEAHIIYLDEFGFFKFKPEYLIDSVLSPQLDTTKGQLIITSTPPEDLSHPYVDYVRDAASKGYLFEYDIDKWLDCGEIDQTYYDNIVERCGGKDSESFKREYLCHMIPKRDQLVIPEAQNKELYDYRQDRPDYYFPFVMFDFGFHDFTAGLFGYVDFAQSKLIIERELWLHYKSTKEIYTEAKKIEQELGFWGHPKIRRMGDSADQQQIYDLCSDHQYNIVPIQKRSKQSNTGFRDSVINQVRLGLSQQKIGIDIDNCPNLVSQLKYGIWNEKRTDFERTSKLGHLDVLMSLCYMYDNADWYTNPWPVIPESVKGNTHHINYDRFENRNKKLGRIIGK